MVDKISFGLQASDGTPLTGLTIGPAGLRFLKYVDRDGSARAQPTLVEIGGGQYGFVPTTSDEEVGTCYLIECTTASEPRRVSGAIHKVDNPFICWHLEKSDASLWDGVDPSITVWNKFDGSAQTPQPSIVDVGGFGYLFAVTPSSVDLEEDVAFCFESPATAYPERVTGSLEGVTGIDFTNVGSAIRALLLADATVASLVSTRIYPNVLPQSVTLPAIVYSVISDVPELSFDGAIEDTLASVRMQIDCYARPVGSGAYGQVHQVAAAVKAVIGNLSAPGFNANYETMRDLYDDQTRYHRVSMDFIVWR